MLESFLTDLKQSHADTVDSHLKEMTIERHRFKKTGNGNQYRFNLKVSDAMEEAEEACSSKQLDEDHAALEKGEKLLLQRQKLILLATEGSFPYYHQLKTQLPGNVTVTVQDPFQQFRQGLRPNWVPALPVTSQDIGGHSILSILPSFSLLSD